MVDIVVKKPYERFDWRVKIGAMNDREAREWQVNEFIKVKNDKEYWFNQYVWIIDAQKKKVIPFILFPYQVKLIGQLDKFKDTFIEKSRCMGVSWTIMGWEEHQALYTKGFTALNISRKESEVQDKGNTYHALMGRLYFIWKRLPPYIQPKIHNPFLTFQVIGTDSIIKGESSNKKAGRDTQFTFVFIDEAAHIPCLDEMWTGVRSSSESICINSTPPKDVVNSKYSEIKDMKKSGFTKMLFHWKERPDRDDAWYKRKTAAMTPADIAQELEIDEEKSMTNRSYEEYVDEIHLSKHKIYVNNKIRLNIFMDFGLDGEVFLFNQVDNKERIFFLKYSIYRNKLIGELYLHLQRDLADLGYTGALSDILFVGDTAGTRRSRSMISPIQEYSQISNGEIKIRNQAIPNIDKILCMKKCLKSYEDGQPKFNVSNEPSCVEFSKCMKYITKSKKGIDHVDNKYTHAVNAAEYGVYWLFPYRRPEIVVAGVDLCSSGEYELTGASEEENESFHKELLNNERACACEAAVNVTAPTSIATTIGSRRINRRSLIWQ